MGKELHLGRSWPPPPPSTGGKPEYQGGIPPGSSVLRWSPGFFLFCTLRYLMNITVRLFRQIVIGSNANLWKNALFVPLSTKVLPPFLLVLPTSRPQFQTFVTALTFKGFKILRHSEVARWQRNGSSEELDAAVDHFCFYFPVVQRPQLCFTYRRYEYRTDQRTN